MKNFRTLNRYMVHEYLVSFAVSFFFFFFVFFVNQILVLAQKIMLKNVSISDVLILVVLSIPQFLMYTMPFSSLASASMVLGNLGSSNEITAMRSSGIHVYRIFLPVIYVSLILSAATFMIADKLIPFTASQYVKVYSAVLKKLPGLELESYSSRQFGKIVISNGLIDNNTIYNVTIMDNSKSADSKTITAESAEISVIDATKLIYKIDMKNPQILITDGRTGDSYSLSKAEGLTLYLNLMEGSSYISSLSPSQMSISSLREKIKSSLEDKRELEKIHTQNIYEQGYSIGNQYLMLENSSNDTSSQVDNIGKSLKNFTDFEKEKVSDFYYQYYKSELVKKIALSMACTFLVFIAFPLSFLKIKYGRLTGFGLSMLVACVYWFFLYYMHATAIQTAINPAILLFLPDIVVFAIGLVLILRLGKR